MRARGKNLFVILILTAFLTLLSPLIAKAQTSSTSTSTSSTSSSNSGTTDPSACKQALAQSLGAAAQASMAVAGQIFNAVGIVDTRVNTCLTVINQLLTMNASISNPWTLITNIFINQIIQLADQACGIALSTIQSLEASALSVFNLTCVALPHFSLSGGFQFPKIPCNGTQLVSPALTPAGTPTPPGYWQIWNLTPNSPPSTGSNSNSTPSSP